MPIIHCALVVAFAIEGEAIIVNRKTYDVCPHREKTLSPTG